MMIVVTSRGEIWRWGNACRWRWGLCEIDWEEVEVVEGGIEWTIGEHSWAVGVGVVGVGLEVGREEQVDMHKGMELGQVGQLWEGEDKDKFFFFLKKEIESH